MTVTAEQRKMVAHCCRIPERRILGRNAEMGSRWHPHSVTHPESGGRFSDASAWEFIADALEDLSIEATFSPPAGRFPIPAIILIVPIAYDDRRLYMKVGLVVSQSTVVGLSFHYSTEEYRDD